jgi:hypothetical protein
MDLFLNKLQEKFPESNPNVLWERATAEVTETYCTVMINGEFRVCGLQKREGVCPYHLRSKVDFLRSCEYINDDNTMCMRFVVSRDVDVVWCNRHLGGVDIKLRRVGDFIVIRGTPYAISDDMLSIIGRVGMTEQLQFHLIQERDIGMDEVSKRYRLSIRLD